MPLNSYLHKIKRAESNKCQSCKSHPEDEETPPETINHFLYNCEAYTQQRRILAHAIGAANLPLREIMMETKHMRELVRYITRTGRFKDK